MTNDADIEWEFLDSYDVDWGHHPELGEVWVYAGLSGFFWSFDGPSAWSDGTWPERRSPTLPSLAAAKKAAEQGLAVRDARRRLMQDDESSAESVLTALMPTGDA